MNIAIAGGMKKLEKNYRSIGKKYGIKCKTYNTETPNFSKCIKNVDAVILCTNTVSHNMAKICCKVCKKYDVCLKRVHSSSVSQLDKAMAGIKDDYNLV